MNQVVSGDAEAKGEVWSVKRVLSWAADDLRKRGNDSARLDVELLLSRVLKLDRIGLIMHSERPLAPAELAAFRELFKRRRAGEPVAYLLGEREFYGIQLRVDARVLIPRPDSERLVEVALERTRARSMLGAALDLCTGSGCVAIAFARARPTWSVTASDISADALAVARDNAHRTGTIRNLRLLEGSLFTPVGGRRFDLVTANPPYIPSGDIPGLPVDVRGFEPHLALDGGHDGLLLVRRIASEATQYLTPGGLLALEIGADQGPAAQAILAEHGFRELELAQDLGGRDRVVSGYGPL
ncbi:MAG TPA: peptide chain release factor N(5)-glutamine methyltransferase [Polyangiaceae bacterium]|nr:peptide chain release factor N(5)-glutamine methyltransferase [Polyangiaceae bacterium]